MQYIAGMKKLQVSFLFAVVLTSALTASAKIFGSRHVESPQVFEQLTVAFGDPVQALGFTKKSFQVYVWNIHKAKDENLPVDFAASSKDADLVLFQEAVNSAEFTKALVDANPHLRWTMAKSWSVSGETYTGVATGSSMKPLNQEVIVSDPIEPITRTHKTMLISQYVIADRSLPLMVVNLHGINFVTTKTFEIQIRQVMERIKEHKGPLLVGGDFNTWNNNRLDFLEEVFAPLGLKLVNSEKNGLFNLDHVFIRGLKATRVQKLASIKSSDHTPLVVDLEFEPQPLESHEKP